MEKKSRTAPAKSKKSASRTKGRKAPEKPILAYSLQLYVTGQTPRSQRSIENLRALCQKYLPNKFELEVIDIYQQPGLAASVQLIAAPTLIKSLPLPLRRLVGDLSDKQRVLRGLDIEHSASE